MMSRRHNINGFVERSFKELKEFNSLVITNIGKGGRRFVPLQNLE